MAQRKHEARRSFLLGTITGISGTIGLGIIGVVLNALSSHGESTVTQDTSTPTPASTSSGASTVIAQVRAVAKNGSKTFTLPSTGDPGVLIHLPNDQFVAYDTVCTHQGCLVAYDPASQHIVCPCHGATYDPARQAAVLAGPTNTPLKSIPIHIDSATGAITVG